MTSWVPSWLRMRLPSMLAGSPSASGCSGFCARTRQTCARGVTRLRLFGSVARAAAGPDSDVDLIAEIDHASGFSLLDLVGLQHDLEDQIGRKVEIATAAERMRPRIRRRVEADSIEVF